MGPADSRRSSQIRANSHYHDSSISSNSSLDANPQTRPGALEDGLANSSGRIHKPPWIRGVESALPKPVAKAAHSVVHWTKGPDPPRIWRIRPFFPQIQQAPTRFIDRYAPKPRHRFWLLILLYFCWLLCFVTILHQSAFSDEIPGYGAPSSVSCTDTFWTSNNGCGLNGNDCRPFENSTLAFRCPANCLSTQVLNPRAIGDQVVNYRPLVVGGPNDTANPVDSAVYRGDSFICSSAIHAGFITNGEGGCGVVSLIGNHSTYPSSTRNDIESISFDASFPLAFRFLSETATKCADLRWPLLAVTLILTTLLSLFTTSPSIFFSSTFAILFIHVALVSDPPSQTSYPSLVSSALGRLLPAAFVAYAIYHSAVRRTLTSLTAQIEKTVLWLGPCIVGCLNNYTFDKIPIQRLTPHDLNQQPGAITALVIIALVILVIALGQVYAIRLEGHLRRYLALYVGFGIVLGLLAAIPNMNLRIHHYILALLLLPGTALQTRPSLIYQGLLVGLFINGIARWGFDSILQTPDELRGDALLGSALPNVTATPEIVGGRNGNITFGWNAEPFPDDFDGVSVLVDDVERWRGYVYDDEDQRGGGDGGSGGGSGGGGVTGSGSKNASEFTWTRRAEYATENVYFRFGFVKGSVAGDYTKAGIWRPPPPKEGNEDGDGGSYEPMPEGAT